MAYLIVSGQLSRFATQKLCWMMVDWCESKVEGWLMDGFGQVRVESGASLMMSSGSKVPARPIVVF